MAGDDRSPEERQLKALENIAERLLHIQKSLNTIANAAEVQAKDTIQRAQKR